MIMEKWKPIRDAPDYDVSSNGGIYSRKRNIVMKVQTDGWGYPRVSLLNNGHKSTKYVHRLVADAFIKNPLNKPEINHIDGNKLNNRIDNLEWVTRSENEIHAFKTKLNDRSSYDAGKNKKKVTISETGETFESITECSKKLGCSHTAIINCLQGKSKTCKGYHIKTY